MPGEIEEIVSESIEELAVDDLIGEAAPGTRRKQRWEMWVALSSSLLAVLAAGAALLATFASDRAAVAQAGQTEYAAVAEGVDASHTMLRVKAEILQAMGASTTSQHETDLLAVQARQLAVRTRMEDFADRGERANVVHDRLAIALTLFQVHMLLGGLAVMVERVAIWRFGFLFTTVGAGFLIAGVRGYLS
ncbi:DUF4337 family protein [Luteitalea sp.]|uniref:DUF4337 family protein n=1 Tax=Luteitalea sp. TaxID=2004800 RepID=UPI0025BDF1E8|nr:DUF4337 family protein [Luteitalea sp.]